MEQEVLNAVAREELDEADIDRSVQRVKKMVLDAQQALKNGIRWTIMSITNWPVLPPNKVRCS